MDPELIKKLEVGDSVKIEPGKGWAWTIILDVFKPRGWMFLCRVTYTDCHLKVGDPILVKEKDIVDLEKGFGLDSFLLFKP